MVQEQFLNKTEKMSQKNIIDLVLQKYQQALKRDEGRSRPCREIKEFLQFPGLHNLGNTCFANSVLQCLIHTKYIQAYCANSYHSKYCRSKIKKVFDDELLGVSDQDGSTQFASADSKSIKSFKQPPTQKSVKLLIQSSRFV